ncbi:transcriptional regulator [Bradyrhizobium sp. CCBAU 11434]|uniref:XRE family transcriptional regulator n=1 Tax=Bradyrhizobium zhengyangense TaxID=2911009 RepID=A0ABS9LW45_9BRAD|nr:MULTISPECIES: XRE family transcriptional regulator [Bradyrhizobium]MCG2643641.1 XRE family transcriptional regulator [Bradyrhizobium zhengyangense]MCG2671241.1 XRE family transcriptional regulator [Bradyrhizobium zhengyangense]MDA9519128.1 transcriptional regulator [Bradyrhizobium sp. CCBAU 11434]
MRKPAVAKPARNGNKSGKKATAKPTEPAMDVAVGRRIRDLRRVRQFSLETVAARTELSIGFLSQIERGLSSPSLRVLATLADVLGVGIAALFGASPSADGASDQVVTRGLQRPELKLWRSGISKQLLSAAGSDNRLNLFLVHIDPGGSAGDELYTHDGEEAGLVLEGEMMLTVDSETWSLKAGDSFRFASRRPHRFSNPAQETKAVVLWVNCVTGAG